MGSQTLNNPCHANDVAILVLVEGTCCSLQEYDDVGASEWIEGLDGQEYLAPRDDSVSNQSEARNGDGLNTRTMIGCSGQGTHEARILGGAASTTAQG
jgi:hypothetical protein